MLKIKDGIPLRILLSYGFEYIESKNEYFRIYYDTELDGDEILIGEDRIIRNWTCLEIADDSYCGENPLEEPLKFKIDDLIKDGLVEKVEG